MHTRAQLTVLFRPLRMMFVPSILLTAFLDVVISPFLHDLLSSQILVPFTEIYSLSNNKYQCQEIDVVTSCVQGAGAFYKGFLPNFGRLGSWNVIMFLTLEQVCC